jgi:hypothetical protein
MRSITRSILVSAILGGLVLYLWYVVHLLIPHTPIVNDVYNIVLPTCDVSKGIPKKIWTFWDSDTRPEVIDRCIQSWHRMCPSYEITILTPGNLSEYVDNATEILALPYSDTPQRLADFIRLHVLYDHGGYWVDASILMFQSLDVFEEHQRRTQVELVGYYLEGFTTDPAYPMIENWFFGCVPRSTFVGRWRNEFMRINLYPLAASYVDHARIHGTCIRGMSLLMSYYLSMHVAAQIIMQHDPCLLDKCHLQKADASDGPLGYLQVVNWDSGRAVASLPTATGPFIKFRSSERGFITRHPELVESIFG